MATNYTGNVTPSLSNAPASSWTDDAAKRSHVGNTYLVTGSGGTAGNVYAFEEYAAPLVKNASGLPADIVTITDGGEDLPMTKAEVSLSPIQSLNGYDHPWAAGAGKNKALPYTDRTSNADVTYTVTADGVKINGTATSTSYSFVGHQSYADSVIKLPAGTYTFSASAVPGASQYEGYLVFYGYTSSGTQISNIVLAGTTLSKTVTFAEYVGINYGFVVVRGRTANVDSKIMIESGSSATSFAPYSNLCPISGHTGATLKIGTEYPAADREYTSSFGQTVYGGTFDFVIGKLVVDMASVDLGDLTYTMLSDSVGAYFRALTPENAKKPPNNSAANAVCSAYKNVDSNHVVNGSIAIGSSVYTFIRNFAYSDAASFKTAMVGQKLVYELATPIEIDLDPTEVETLLGLNNVWASDGQISALTYQSNQFIPKYDWFETWNMPKITRNNGSVIVLPYPKEYTPEIHDVDAATTGRNAAGTMIRDRVAIKHKFNYVFPPLSQADATELLAATKDASFTLTTASPETGAKTNYRVYAGDKSLPVYWMPNHDTASWLYSSVSVNLIEM